MSGVVSPGLFGFAFGTPCTPIELVLIRFPTAEAVISVPVSLPLLHPRTKQSGTRDNERACLVRVIEASCLLAPKYGVLLRPGDAAATVTTARVPDGRRAPAPPVPGGPLDPRRQIDELS